MICKSLGLLERVMVARTALIAQLFVLRRLLGRVEDHESSLTSRTDI